MLHQSKTDIKTALANLFLQNSEKLDLFLFNMLMDMGVECKFILNQNGKIFYILRLLRFGNYVE